MKKYEFPIIIERDEDGMYIATAMSLKGCHTQARTIPTLLKRIKEAILLCMDVEKNVPRLRFVGLQEIEVKR